MIDTVVSPARQWGIVVYLFKDGIENAGFAGHPALKLKLPLPRRHDEERREAIIHFLVFLASQKNGIRAAPAIGSGSMPIVFDYRFTQRSLRITHFSPATTSRPSWSMQSRPCLCNKAIPVSRVTTMGSGEGWSFRDFLEPAGSSG